MKRYLDSHMEAKKKIPSPDKYECNAHKANFNDVKKKSKIFCYERKSYIDVTIKDAAKLPGVARYSIDTYDEAKNKPPRGYAKVKDEKYSRTDEVIYASKQSPFNVNDTNLVSIKLIIHFLNYF